jgi:hypothetical protein
MASLLQNGGRLWLPRLRNLFEDFRISGQFVGDALERRIVVTGIDRPLGVARRRFDRRSRLFRIHRRHRIGRRPPRANKG